jgi:ABC-2 type transport system permease protein
MNELNLTVHARGQLAAIANLRWRLFINSLRTTRGKLEFLSRGLVSLAFLLGGLGGCFGMALGAFYFLSAGKPELLALLLWPVFFFWQVFPVMATALTNNPDSSNLLRFPLSYRSYFLVRLAYGSLDIAPALGSMWLTGIFLGIGFARPTLLPWAGLVLLAFGLVNLLIMQMVFAWVERWLARRRTREVLGVLFILLMLSLQLIGPLVEHFGRRSRPEMSRWIELLRSTQALFPPGLAADAVAQAARSHFMVSFSSFLLLCAFGTTIGYFLHLRLGAQYRGENLSEVAARSASIERQPLRLSWNLPGLPPSVAAVFEKEIRYLARSGPMLLTLIMPIFMLVIFRLGPMSRQGSFFARTPNMAFPAAAGYALLILTNLVYNNFGGDASGIQFFYASPVRFSQIVLAKNLTHATILVLEMALAWVAVTYLYGPPAPGIALATLAGLLFAAPVNLAAGNLLSMYSPKKLDYSTFGRQRASQTTVLVSLLVQIVVVGLGVTAFLVARSYGRFWIASAIFLALAAISVTAYVIVLKNMDRIAEQRRETLISELCRT